MTMTSVNQTPKVPVNTPAAPPTPVDNTAQVVPQVSTSATPTAAQAVVETKPDPRDPWGGIEAKPLHAPAFDQIKKKNPNIELRWGNRSVMTSATPHMRYEQLCSQGWVPVAASVNPDGTYKCDDVVPPPGSVKDGRIQIYDVILMKIDRAKYIGALRYNNERVNNAVRRPGVLAGANENLRGDIAKAGALGAAFPKGDRPRVQPFVPGEKDFK